MTTTTVELRQQHACSFYQLLILFTIALLPCTTLSRNFAHGAFAAAAVDVVASSSASSASASAVGTSATLKSDNKDFDLDAAAAVVIDSLLISSPQPSSSSSSSPSKASAAASKSSSASNSDRDLEMLVFEPSSLSFDELSVGETSNRVVTIFNRHANRSVYLGSISGTAADFYSSYFEENLVPPQGNTTFNVVFLPRQQATLQAKLVIHTSFGVANYDVRGKGAECPYRLTPLIGLRAPLNATLTPEVHMYNPYDTPLQIVEVYSSGGQFQLELPTDEVDKFDERAKNNGDVEGDRSQGLWEIPPYCSKPVIRVRFTATTVGNHTAYIRIKVSSRDNPALESSIIVLPIEVEIFREHGLYSSIPFLNFGLGGSNDQPKNILFRLLNSGKEPLEIDTLSVEAEPDVRSGVTLEMDTVVDAKANETYQTITATVNWPKIQNERMFRGNILIKSKPKTDTRPEDREYAREMIYRIPFVGSILVGSVQYNESLTRFHIAKADDRATAPSPPRDFRLKNNFDVALAVTNLTLSPDSRSYFRVDNFKSQILAPGEESTLFRIVQLAAAAQQSITQYMHLHTNASTYDVELLTFDGLLKRLLPLSEKTESMRLRDVRTAADEKSINFGILSLSTMTYTTMAFVNTNPITIDIRNWKGTISSAAHIGITVPGCSPLTMARLKFCNNVKPGEWIIFRIGVMSNTVGNFEGKITVETDYEVINTPIKFSTDMGVLRFTTKTTNKGNCFPVSS